ncbi:hypothetical protein GCM10027048_44660 [Hymenobacter coalescens]
MKSAFLFTRGLLLAVTALGLASCDDGDAPRYSLTPGERAWADVYQAGNVWTFRNAATGYERRYKVTEVKDKMQAHVPKSLNVSYYQQMVKITLLREDSTSFRATGTANDVNMRGYQLLLNLQAQTSAQAAHLDINWTAGFSVPVGTLEQGAPAPPPFLAANGRTYANVVQLQYTPPSSPWHTGPQPAWQLRRIYYSKAVGIIQFEEVGGQVWVRQ